ncbi:class I SAM-dependent methyltransferase [Oricola cellulosilytica]|nr:class I SAM-dependent methyltransferase [Oricola cellulosilytica]
MADTEDLHWWFCGRRAVAGAVLDSLGLPEPLSILEIGAGTGGNIAMLSRYGTVTAVEMDANARLIASEKTGVSLLAGHLPDGLPNFEGKFDLICLFDVLEHVERDGAALEAISGLVAPGGRLLLTVPAHQWLWSHHDKILHHFRRYSRAGLAEVLRSTGYAIERLTFTNSALFPAAAAARLLDRGLSRGKEAPSSGSDMPPRLANAVMKWLFRSEKYILGRFDSPIGLGLLAIARPIGTASRVQAENSTAAI